MCVHFSRHEVTVGGLPSGFFCCLSCIFYFFEKNVKIYTPDSILLIPNGLAQVSRDVDDAL